MAKERPSWGSGLFFCEEKEKMVSSYVCRCMFVTVTCRHLGVCLCLCVFLPKHICAAVPCRCVCSSTCYPGILKAKRPWTGGASCSAREKNGAGETSQSRISHIRFDALSLELGVSVD